MTNGMTMKDVVVSHTETHTRPSRLVVIVITFNGNMLYVLSLMSLSWYDIHAMVVDCRNFDDGDETITMMLMSL